MFDGHKNSFDFSVSSFVFASQLKTSNVNFHNGKPSQLNTIYSIRITIIKKHNNNINNLNSYDVVGHPLLDSDSFWIDFLVHIELLVELSKRKWFFGAWKEFERRQENAPNRQTKIRNNFIIVNSNLSCWLCVCVCACVRYNVRFVATISAH